MEIARAGNLGSIESSGTCQYWVCWRRRCRPFAIYLYKLPNQFADDCMSAGSYFLQIGRLQSLTIGAFWILFEANVMPGFLFCSPCFSPISSCFILQQRGISCLIAKEIGHDRGIKGQFGLYLKLMWWRYFFSLLRCATQWNILLVKKSGNANSPLALHHMNDRKCVSVLCEEIKRFH